MNRLWVAPWTSEARRQHDASTITRDGPSTSRPQVVARFVEHLRNERVSELKIERWPEDENPGQSEIEAIAGDLAIEHTSIDTLPQPREIGNHFEEALAILERLPVSARLSINVPYGLVKVGTDWNSFRLAIAHWILNLAPELPDGVHQIELSGTTLRCTAIKESDRRTWRPLESPCPRRRHAAFRVGGQIRRKARKLARYRAQGYPTVLLLETRPCCCWRQRTLR